jgi:hypothetical protein
MNSGTLIGTITAQLGWRNGMHICMLSASSTRGLGWGTALRQLQ